MESIVEQAIYDALTGSASLIAIIPKVYQDIAPSTANVTSYVLFSLNAGATTNDANDDNVDLRYLVKAVSQSLVTAENAADIIRPLFNEATLTLSGSWGNYRTQIATPVRYVETVDRVQYWHRGYVVRIQASKARA